MENWNYDLTDEYEEPKNIISRYSPHGLGSYQTKYATVKYLYNSVLDLSWTNAVSRQCYAINIFLELSGTIYCTSCNMDAVKKDKLTASITTASAKLLFPGNWKVCTKSQEGEHLQTPLIEIIKLSCKKISTIKLKTQEISGTTAARPDTWCRSVHSLETLFITCTRW